MDFDTVKLENQLCFPMYAATRTVMKKYKPYLDEIGLTYTQYIAMMVLWERKTINVKLLGESLFLDSGTLTPLLKKLEAAGFVERKRSLKDERFLDVTLTEKGAKLRAEADSIPTNVVNDIGINIEEATVIYGILQKILKNSV